jgi:predicted transcriptional regulator
VQDLRIRNKKGRTVAAPDIIKEAVRKALHDNPGIKIGEIAATLGIALNTSRRYVRELRAEWARKDGEAGK